MPTTRGLPSSLVWTPERTPSGGGEGEGVRFCATRGGVPAPSTSELIELERFARRAESPWGERVAAAALAYGWCLSDAEDEECALLLGPEELEEPAVFALLVAFGAEDDPEFGRSHSWICGSAEGWLYAAPSEG